MSALATSRAWAAAVSPHAKLVLLYFARVADDAGQACPPVDAIARSTGFGRSTVQRALRELRRNGVIFPVHGAAHGRGVLYQLFPVEQHQDDAYPISSDRSDDVGTDDNSGAPE